MALLGNILKRTISIKKTIDRVNVKNKGYRVQRKTLKKLLTKAQFTAFGMTYNFEGMLNARHYVKEFQKRVPTFDYDTIHQKWWSRALAEEENVCWPGKINYFALSSGTSGAPSKYIPVTRSQIAAIRRGSLKSVMSLAYYDLPSTVFEKGVLTVGGSTDLTKEKSYYKGDLSGITVNNIPLWVRRFQKIGREITDEKDWTIKINKIVESAKDWDVSVICGVPAWIQLIFERIIKHYNLKTIHDVWPNLKVFIHGGVAFEPYKKGIDKLCTTPLIYIDTYLASEGFLAYQSRPDTRSMELILNNGIFFEFVPFNENNFDAEGKMIENPKTLLLNEVEEGVDYALLISTCAGAWRYLIGDTVKFTDKFRNEIIITGRTKQFLSLCGEHLSVDNMNSAVEAACEKLNMVIPEYTVTGIKHNDSFAHQWYIGSNDKVDVDVLKKTIDETLKSVNDDYITEREHALKNIFVNVLPVDTFYGWMRANGKEGGQHKFPRVLKGEIQLSWESFINLPKLK